MTLAGAALDPIACAILLIVSFVVAGVAHTVWLGSPLSRPLGIALDGGRTWRGRRLLGDHKTLRGFLVLPPAAALALGILGPAARSLGLGVWPLYAAGYAALGLAAGFGFMLGELPNSFLKRRLDVAPGETAARTAPRLALLALDRLDSIVGMLVVASLLVPTPWITWAVLLGVGPLLHLAFSARLHARGVKRRRA